jgi:hypothetical protein
MLPCQCLDGILGLLEAIALETKMTRQGLRALRPTRPAGSVDDLAELDKANPTRDNGLDFAPWHTSQEKPGNSGLTNREVRRKVLAARNPLLLLRFVGTLLLR